MRLEDFKGQRLGRYAIIELIGRGGMAAVYRAHDSALRRDVAIKVLYPQYSVDQTLIQRFQREAVLSAQLDHPNIVPIYDVGEQDGMTYIAMRLLPGQSFGDLLASRRILTPPELLTIITQIAAALDYAHSRGIVHRDIKPANILLEAVQGDQVTIATRAVLTDFGIAKSIDTSGLTSTGAMIGTPDYMAPEQIRGDRSVDCRTDVYALGILAYRCLTGKRPFEGTTQEVLIGHLDGEFSSPSAVNPSLPQAIDPVIRQAMALRPEQRYLTAGAFVSALGNALSARTARPAAATVANPAPKSVANQQQPTNRNGSAQEAPVTTALVRQPQRIWPIVAVIFSIVSMLAVGLLIGRLSAEQREQPLATTLAIQPSTIPTATIAPSATLSIPSVTALPPTSVPALTPKPSEVIVAQPTAISTATLPATATLVPATATPSPSPLPSPLPTSEPTATLVAASATPMPTSTPALIATPSATPCPIAGTGGFSMLIDRNERVRTRMGCATSSEQGGTASIVEQPFERGSMLYFIPSDEIYVLHGSDSGDWFRFDPAQGTPGPTATPVTPPSPELIVPVRGFGEVWAANEEIRTRLGFATAPEAGPLEGARQSYIGGTMLYSEAGIGRGQSIYVLYADGTFERYDDPNQ